MSLKNDLGRYQIDSKTLNAQVLSMLKRYVSVVNGRTTIMLLQARSKLLNSYTPVVVSARRAVERFARIVLI